MNMSRQVQVEDFFHQDFPNPSAIVHAAPPDAVYAGAAHPATAIAPLPDLATAWDFSAPFSALFSGAQNLFNSITADPLSVCAIAATILVVLGIGLSRLQRRGRPAIALHLLAPGHSHDDLSPIRVRHARRRR